MRLRCLILFALTALALLGLSACNRAAKDGAADGTAASKDGAAKSKGQTRQLSILFDATESDPWASELINTIGTELGFDPWKSYSQSGHLDVYGPYDGHLGDYPVRVSIGLSGLTGVADLLSQQVLGEEAREWLVTTKPDLVWLDGDQAQFMVGRELPAELPIVFTGAIGEREFYYAEGREVTGVYRRYSLPKVIAEIWRDAPEAASIALLSDNSSPGQAQRQQFRRQLELLQPESNKLEPPPPVESWQMLREQLKGQKDAEAIVVCGFDEALAVPALADKPLPADLLAGIDKSVVVLGPCLLDQSGALSLRLIPSAHAGKALEICEKLFEGVRPLDINPITPQAMQRFVRK